MSSPQNLSKIKDRLHYAQRDHDDHRRGACTGVMGVTLDADNDLWRQLGAAIADLANQICSACRDSRYCSERPEANALAARLSESIDDQIDPSAWAVINASALLHAAAQSA